MMLRLGKAHFFLIRIYLALHVAIIGESILQGQWHQTRRPKLVFKLKKSVQKLEFLLLDNTLIKRQIWEEGGRFCIPFKSLGIQLLKSFTFTLFLIHQHTVKTKRKGHVLQHSSITRQIDIQSKNSRNSSIYQIMTAPSCL